MTPSHSRVGWLLWPIAVLVVLGHLSLGVLAVLEYAHFGWLASEPYEFTAVGVVAASAAFAVGGAMRVAWLAVRSYRAVRRLLRLSPCPLPVPLRDVIGQLGLVGRVDVIATGEAFAVTHGLWRTRILLSTGLVDTLDRAELTAVLAHERHHLGGRDPLRLLAARVLAGYGWYLPILAWWMRGQALRRELAADRAATARTGVAAVAGALLKLADLPALPAAAAINPAGNLPDRIAQLEGRAPERRPGRGWWLAGATLAPLAGLAAAATCCTGLGVAMLGGMS
jgi:Zn-dependent protease with chaperone function